MDITFNDIKFMLEEESSEEQKENISYEKITKHNTKMFERIKSVGSDYDQASADSLITLLNEVEILSPLPQSRKLIETYIEDSGLKVNR